MSEATEAAKPPPRTRSVLRKRFAASLGALRASENSLALDFFPERGTRQSVFQHVLHSASLGALRASENSLALDFFPERGTRQSVFHHVLHSASLGALRASENSLTLDFFPERGTRQKGSGVWCTCHCRPGCVPGGGFGVS